MAEELVMPFGTKTSVLESTNKVAKNGEPFGTLSVERASITLDAAYALPTVLLK